MNTATRSHISKLTDRELIASTSNLAQRARTVNVQLLLHLAEMDKRRLYRGEGCSSLFTYCVQVLHISEGAAYKRIAAARAGRRFPLVFECLARGEIHLSALAVLAPHLTQANHRELLARARHKSRTFAELIVAEIAPKPPVATSIRKVVAPMISGATAATLGMGHLPSAASASGSGDQQSSPQATLVDATPAPRPIPAPPARLQPLSVDTYRVQFTADAESIALLRRAQDLLQHQAPGASPESVIKLALAELVARLEKQKAGVGCRSRSTRESGAAESSPASEPRARESRARTPNCPRGQLALNSRSSSSRYIPVSVRRAVWSRDGARCAFRSSSGKRCTETGRLEFHHVKPFARGGPSTSANLELRCRVHNGYEYSRVEHANGVREGSGQRYRVLPTPPTSDSRTSSMAGALHSPKRPSYEGIRHARPDP